jgi:hypothetical protein
MQPALALLYDSFGKPDNKTHPDLVTDGNPSYDGAVALTTLFVAFYNFMRLKSINPCIP